MNQVRTAYRLLIIDDEPALRGLLQKLLSAEGYECFLAAGAEEGLRACESGKPDLILLDVNLPDGNGIEVCRRFKERPELKHIPILIMTGDAKTAESRIDGLEAGADDYILKPFLPTEVVARMRAILKVSVRPAS